jgi:hypothetical protein
MPAWKRALARRHRLSTRQALTKEDRLVQRQRPAAPPTTASPKGEPQEARLDAWPRVAQAAPVAQVSRKKNGRFLARFRGHTAYGKTASEAADRVYGRASFGRVYGPR